MTFSLPEKKTVPEHQADAVLSQDNPVSETWYTVLNTTKNVRLLSLYANITWAVTQPTPLEVRVTIDGQTETFSVSNPVSGTDYVGVLGYASASYLINTLAEQRSRAFLLEGRSVKVEARITWATTQPTPLVCRVKYAKY